MNLQRGRILARRTRAELITIIAEGCPVCTTGRSRVTEGMVCQHCGRDYVPLVDELAAPLRAWLEELRGFAAGSDSARATLMRDAADALEKAHAPTDDEREALAEVIEPFDFHGTEPVETMADAILAAGFRRTVQGEPTDATVTTYERAAAVARSYSSRPGDIADHEIGRQER